MNIPDILRSEPLAILIDRSKDYFGARVTMDLCPQGLFAITDNRRPLSATRLLPYDILVLCSNGVTRYRRSELEAIRAFVRRGGGLVLAAGAGSFAVGSELPAQRLALQRVAALFGFAFEPTTDLVPDLHGRRGYDARELVLTPAGRRLGMRIEDLWIERPGPLTIPRGAQVLLRHIKGAPVAARATYGCGRILVMGDLGMWNCQDGSWDATFWLMAVAPERRASPAALPRYAGRPYTCLTRGPVRLYHTAATRQRARATLALAAEVWVEVSRLFPYRGKDAAWEIFLEPGMGYHPDWGRTAPFRCYLGADLSPAARVQGMADLLTNWIGKTKFGWELYHQRFAICYYVMLRVLTTLGFAARAQWLRTLTDTAMPIDLGRYYSELPETAFIRRFWVDLVEVFGPGALRKLAEVIPPQNPFQYIPPQIYSNFDRFAYLLAYALGPRIYHWLQRGGHTVRRLPLVEPGSEALRKAMSRTLKRILTDPAASAADRYAALGLLGDQRTERPAVLERAARRQSATALPAIARLVKAHDVRGTLAARRYLRSHDRALAASVALLLTFETDERRARDVLYRLAPEQDLHFQLCAGHALRRAGDRRHRRFAFTRLAGCELQTVNEEGLHKTYVRVAGEVVGNVWCRPYFWYGSYGTGFSTWYVDWVHTAPRWRRRGLMAHVLPQTLETHWGQKCATVGLHTGQSNVAHTLYRQQKMVDIWTGLQAERPLGREVPLRAPRGISIRPMEYGDIDRAWELATRVLAPRAIYRRVPNDWVVRGPALLAFEGGRLVGLANARVNGERAELDQVVVAELPKTKGRVDPERREKVGLALLSRLHRALQRGKVKRIEREFFGPVLDAFHSRLLQRAGYATKRRGQVELHRINDLGQLLEELTPLFAARLATRPTVKGWCGQIHFEGERLRGSLLLRSGRVTASPRPRMPSPELIRIRGCDEALTRILLGATSPQMEHLQTRCEIIPTYGSVTGPLLETLFPSMDSAD